MCEFNIYRRWESSCCLCYLCSRTDPWPRPPVAAVSSQPPASSSMPASIAQCCSYSPGFLLPSSGSQRGLPEAAGRKLHRRPLSLRVVASGDSPDCEQIDESLRASLVPVIQSETRVRHDGSREREREEKEKEREEKERERRRKEEVNRKIASKKAISVILRREATKAVIEKKRGGTNSKKLLPRTVLEALHERVTALRWESALKV